MPNILNRKFQYSFWNVNMMIVALNVIIFFIATYFYPYLNYVLAMMPLRILAEPSSIYTFVTYMFAHSGIPHLFSNMLGLLIFGTILERRIGSKEYVCNSLILSFVINGISTQL